MLDGKKISYKSHSYEADATLTGAEIAGILGENAAQVFKTLVTQGKSGQYYVFAVPVESGLDLKKAAKDFSKIFVSAGRVGMQVELAPEDLIKIVNRKLADVASEESDGEA